MPCGPIVALGAAGESNRAWYAARVTHQYLILTGGTVARGPDEPDATAIAWAEGTIIAIGSDDEVRSVSRGDSAFGDLAGAFVVPLAGDGSLEIGGPASFAIHERDPRAGTTGATRAVVRHGRVVAGTLTPPRP